MDSQQCARRPVGCPLIRGCSRIRGPRHWMFCCIHQSEGIKKREVETWSLHLESTEKFRML